MLGLMIVTIYREFAIVAILQGAAKKMTQHVKCDYLVTSENFCAKFGRIV